jgi:hypothetical protein
LRGEAAVPSSSPMFFQSSPSKADSSAETPDVRMDEPSSPMRASSTVDEGDRTPRGNAPTMRGIVDIIFGNDVHILTAPQTPPPFGTCPAPVQLELRIASHGVPTFPAAAVGYSSRPDPASIATVPCPAAVTFTLAVFFLARAAAAESLSMLMVCLRPMAIHAPMPPFRTSTQTPLRPRPWAVAQLV